MLRKIGWMIIVVLVLLLIGIIVASHFITDWLWFDGLGYINLFLTHLGWEWGVRLVTWFGLSVFLFLNLMVVKRVIKQVFIRYPQIGQYLKPKHIVWIAVLASLVLGLLYSSGYSRHYLDVAQFFNAESFGIVDPIFSKDLGFYFFSLLFYQLLISGLSSALILTLIVCAGLYFLTGNFRLENGSLKVTVYARRHLSILVGAVVLVKAISYYLAGFDLLYNTSGIVFGAGYTDVNIRLIVLRILMVISLIVGIMIITQAYRLRKLFIGSLVLWLAVSLLGGVFLPGLYQQWVVSPNEYTREGPYIDHHIDMTRKAYKINDFNIEDFPVREQLTWEDIEDNQSTINNIRLWDPRLILQTYSQLQEMRPYYSFIDADISRYWVDGEYREVLISARELEISLTQNRNWINDHLQYTHGYGVVVSPVNEMSSQQLPVFWQSDIPPKGKEDLNVVQPRIYYGERTTEYAVVKTAIEEFDYPSGEGNVYYTYQGNGGVPVSSVLHRLMFAVRFGTTRIILSNDITSDTRILFDRDIHTRLNKIAPFLRYDNDPYIVISDEGNLFWIIDAYTISNRYPYSIPISGWGNYIRNSVKVVVDAYNGSVGFYQVEEDPLLEVYSSIFPGWLKQVEEMPEGLEKHIRYPEDLLSIQAQVYGTYHMTDTRVFYNREDVWVLANEIYAEREQPVDPYYVVMQLSRESDPEMMLMIPFTPIRRNNMIAWLGARNDGDNYGEVIVYRFPKDSVTLGPSQIDATIDQDSDISQLLSLWGQRGSSVIRGNLLVMPVSNSVIYVEPLFLQSDQSGMPQLQRVIVAYQDQLVMERTIEQALAVLLGEAPSTLDTTEIRLDQDLSIVADSELGQRAVELYHNAQQALSEADFVEFGKAWEQLESVLNQLINE